jgi:hypothetical protein
MSEWDQADYNGDPGPEEDLDCSGPMIIRGSGEPVCSCAADFLLSRLADSRVAHLELVSAADHTCILGFLNAGLEWDV